MVGKNLFGTNYNHINHMVETCSNKKDGYLVLELIIQSNKHHKPMKCPCDIFGVIGHKMVDCPKFNKMRNL